MNSSVDIDANKSCSNEESIQSISTQAEPRWNEAGDCEWLHDSLQGAWLASDA
jgi:hypothetical protein